MTTSNTQTVAVGMSGGVDSSVAAYLLKKRGYNIVGLTMKLWDGQLGKTCLRSDHTKHKGKSACYGPDEELDIEHATSVAQKLNIPLYIIDLSKQYQEHVITYFRKEYLAGRTPNPCVICNHAIKFGALLDCARNEGISFDAFATGHYCRVIFNTKIERYLLLRGTCRSKDQSYFLHRLSQKQLSHTIFPLGDMNKEDVKKIAKDIGLNFVNRLESQDFMEGNYKELFDAEEVKAGPILDQKGCEVGQHDGIINFTIGQRRGLRYAAGKRVYVTAIDVNKNAIIIGTDDDLMSKHLIATNINWIAFEQLTSKIRASAKIRKNHADKPCTILPQSTEEVIVIFDKPQRAITPGQSIVFYDGDIVLGGGTILSALS